MLHPTEEERKEYAAHEKDRGAVDGVSQYATNLLSDKNVQKAMADAVIAAYQKELDNKNTIYLPRTPESNSPDPEGTVHDPRISEDVLREYTEELLDAFFCVDNDTYFKYVDAARTSIESRLRKRRKVEK